MMLPSAPRGSLFGARLVRNTTSSCAEGPRLSATSAKGPAATCEADRWIVKSDSVAVTDGNGATRCFATRPTQSRQPLSRAARSMRWRAIRAYADSFDGVRPQA